MLTIPYHLLFPAIIAFCCIGAYSVNNNVFDVYAMAMFGLVGWVLIKLDFEPAPLLLGFVLGPDARGEPAPGDDHLAAAAQPSSSPTRLSLGLLLVSAAAARRRPPPQHPRQTRGSLPGVEPVSRPDPSIETEANMAIKDLLVHLDETPASTTRLQAALALAAACGAQVTALYLIAEPFLPGMGGRHLPAELLREHLAHAEAEAETVLAAARAEAERHGTTLDGAPRAAARWTGCRSCWRAMPAAPT